MLDPKETLEGEIRYLRRHALLLLRDRQAADDLVGETLARALARFRRRDQRIRLRTWLFVILYEIFLHGYRSRIRALVVTEGGKLPGESRPAGQEERVGLHELERAFWRLPEDQRLAVLLVAVEGLGYAEAALVLGVPEPTVRARLSRGRGGLWSPVKCGGQTTGKVVAVT